MEEVSIVLGLIILVTVIIMYSRSHAIKSCDQQVRYFDKMYYDLPKLHAVSNRSVSQGLNDRTTVCRNRPVLQAETNQQASRWLGSQDSQPANDASNTRRATNIDVAVDPMQLQSGIKNTHKLKSTFKNRLGRSTRVDGFADDEWLDADFRYADKYSFTGSDVNDDLLKIADIEFNKPDQKIPITIVRKPTAAEIKKVLVSDPIRDAVCARKRARAAGKLSTWW